LKALSIETEVDDLEKTQSVVIGSDVVVDETKLIVDSGSEDDESYEDEPKSVDELLKDLEKKTSVVIGSDVDVDEIESTDENDYKSSVGIDELEMESYE
jgi:hypothetical protein